MKTRKSYSPEITFWKDINGHWHTQHESPETITLKMNKRQFITAIEETNGDPIKLEAILKLGMEQGDNEVHNHIMDTTKQPLTAKIQ
jgi:hypothetical protein